MQRIKLINIKSTAQSWSIDVVLGMVIFMAAFFVFYALLNASPNTKASDLREDALIVIKQTTAEGQIKIIDDNEINISKLNELKDLSYDELKRKLRVEGDFCIYLEDNKGNLILINNSYKGIGAPIINISGTPCSQK